MNKTLKDMSKDNESTNKTMAEIDRDKQNEFLNMFANYSVFLDMVKRTAIETAEAIVKRELTRFYSDLYDCFECDDCNEEISEQGGGGFQINKTPFKLNNKIIKC